MYMFVENENYYLLLIIVTKTIIFLSKNKYIWYTYLTNAIIFQCARTSIVGCGFLYMTGLEAMWVDACCEILPSETKQ